MDWGSNCGNCSAVIAPYALDRGWVSASNGEVSVRIRATNTGQTLHERLAVPQSPAHRTADTFIPGVPFPGEPVEIGFVDPAGGTTGKLLPSGEARTVLQVPTVAGDQFENLEATLVDAGAPVVIISAQDAALGEVDFSLWTTESTTELARLDRIRRAGAVAMGLGLGLAEDIVSAQRAIPKLAIVAAPDAGSECDFNVMMLSMGTPHPALAITGSVGLTLAARTPGSIIASLLRGATEERLRLQTPAGVIETWYRSIGGSEVVGTTRTARLLAEATLSFDPVTDPADGPAQMHLTSELVEIDEPLVPDFEETHLPDPAPHKRRTVLALVGVFAALGLGTMLIAGGLLNQPATTTDGDYAGETLELVIPLAEGGGTDTWARFIGQELIHQIPGTPGFAPTNESGGEGITGSNRFATSADENGTELLVSTATTVVPWVLGRDVVRYSFDKLEPITVNGTGGVIYGRTETGINDVRDLVDRDKPLVFGGIAATGLDLTTLVAFDLLEADMTSTFGFEGRGPVNLALQRGDVDIDYTTTSSYASAVRPIAEDGSAKGADVLRPAQ